jgi:hypothetical protein
MESFPELFFRLSEKKGGGEAIVASIQILVKIKSMNAAEKWMIRKIRPLRRRNKRDNILRSVRYGTVEKRVRNGGQELRCQAVSSCFSCR